MPSNDLEYFSGRAAAERKPASQSSGRRNSDQLSYRAASPSSSARWQGDIRRTCTMPW